jgi:hypothetical protein
MADVWIISEQLGTKDMRGGLSKMVLRFED